ncbi:hypothetical protein ACFWS1_24265, partial [Streptomyces sp. NPDC058612]
MTGPAERPDDGYERPAGPARIPGPRGPADDLDPRCAPVPGEPAASPVLPELSEPAAPPDSAVPPVPPVPPEPPSAGPRCEPGYVRPSHAVL